MSRIPSPNIDYTNRDYESFRNLMINKLQELIPEYTDTSETDAGIVIIEALANGLDILSLYMDIIANDLFLPTTQSRKLAVLLANSLGYYPYEKTASEYEQVFVLTTTREEDTLIPKGTVIKIPNMEDDISIYYETLEDFIIPANSLGNEQDENDNYIYHTTIRSGKTISDDYLGSSTGAVNQTFICSNTGVILDTLQVYVLEDGGEEALWERVDSFIGSNRYSKVYTVSIDELDICTIHFGDGINGKIPDSTISNGIRATYMIGGGEKSNVTPNTITQLDSQIAFVGDTFNLSSNTKAHDKESLESIKINAPATFFIKNRLITLEDYNYLIKANFLEFRNIVTLNDDENNPLHLSIYYRMNSGFSFTQELSDTLTQFINSRQIMGITFTFIECSTQNITGSIKIYTKSGFNVPSDLEDNILSFINNYFEENIDVGMKFIKSDLEEAIKDNFSIIRSVSLIDVNDIISPLNSHTLLRSTLSINSITEV